MNEPDIRLERPCAVPVALLWNTLLRPELWWGEAVRLEAREGGLFHEPWRDGAGQHHTRGEVIEIVPPRCLTLSWRDDDWTFGTKVRFGLVPAGEGSLLQLHHSGWQAAPVDRRDQLLDDHRSGWSYHLGNLTACAERGT